MADEWNVDAVRIAENYERFLVPFIFKPSAEILLDAVAADHGNSVLDVACGTGVVARSALERVGDAGSVAGVDMLNDMLEMARAIEPRIRWEQGSAQQLPFPDRSFDVVVCQQALQFFPDKPAAVAEMRRVSKPGGKLGLAVLRDVSRTPALASLAEALDGYLGPGPADFVRMIGSMDDEATLRSLAEGAGYDEVEVRPVKVEFRMTSTPAEFVRHMVSSTPLAANPRVAQADPEARTGIEKAVTAGLAQYKEGVFPVEFFVATARVA